ncbi:MAG: Gfo/Idh/MocA family oxidoreductase [Synechococcales bacterium]|nr:Gfo/Idh/MocA family oxidoreductase [Synechococcales bacterium]
MTKPVRLAIFGVGRWGVHLLRNFLAHPQAEMVAIADPNPELLQKIQKTFALPSEVYLTSDWQQVLQTCPLDATVVVTPAVTHFELIQDSLTAGLHVLAEKPLTLNYADAIALCQLAEKQQRQLVIDHTYLFHPAVLRGKAILEAGELGDRRYGYATRTHLAPVRADVDALWDLMIHDLAILNYWLGETPHQVSARGSVWLQPGLADMAWATIVYPSGFEANLHGSWLNCDKQRRLCLVGSQGSLIFDELAADPLVLQRGELIQQGVGFQPNGQSREILPLLAQEPLQRVCDHFLNCIQQDQPSTVSSGWLGADLVATLVAMSRSMQHQGAWMPVSPML